MSVRRGDQTGGSSTRGQSAILGLVLLIGMVATVSVGIFLVADQTVSGLEYQSEEERVESAMVELSQHASTSSDSTTASVRSMDLDVGQDGAVVREESGVINVSSDALEDGAIQNLTIGTIEYESDDGTKIAYEAGAVFRETGNETQVVSAPQISYSAATNTLGLPVVTMKGEDRLSSGDITLSHNETTTFQEARVVQNESVTITIESDYYRGWESFFSNQVGDMSVQDVDHNNRTVEVKVGHIDIENAFESGITYSEEFDDFQGAIGDDAQPGTMPEMNPVIEELIADTEDAHNNSEVEYLGEVDGGETISDGMYYAESVNLDAHDIVTADLDDNATLVVNGDFVMGNTNSELTVDPNGEERVLRIYITGDFEFADGTMKPDPSTGDAKAKQLQVYGTSSLDAHFQNGYFHGTFYAASNNWDEKWSPNEVASGYNPECDPDKYQITFQSNPKFDGALVGHSVCLHSAAWDFDYEESLEGTDFDAYPEGYTLPPQLTYLNVAHHEVDVKNN